MKRTMFVHLRLRKLFTIFAAILCATGIKASPAVAVNGKLPNAFSVSANKKVWFSQGNLQYVGTWQFASNQWDYFGTSQYDNHRDLFGWGTGNAPNKVSENDNYSTFTDWGANAITNGGNTANQWRTLTSDEWVFLFNSRTTSSGVRYAKAVVNGKNGLILLPDDWKTSYYALSNTNNGSAAFTSNSITSANWTNSLEAHGAVFLPAAGTRFRTETDVVGNEGVYSSATSVAKGAYIVHIAADFLNLPPSNIFKSKGNSVRLVSETAPPARVTSEPTAKSETITYNGSAKTLFNTGTASGGTMKYQVTTTNSKPGKNSGTWSNSISTATTAGTYYLWYYVYHDANHIDSDVFGPVTKTLSKATPTVTPPTPKSLTYNGSAQVLVNAGATTGGTLQYSLTSGSGFSNNIPTQTNADTYTVYYKVNGNANYNAVAEQSVSVTINPAPLSCTADDKEVTYGDATPTYTATYSGWVNSETQAVLTGSLAFACDYSAGSDVDDYTITPSGVTASNYNITFQTGTLTVNKINPTVTAPSAKSLTYNGSAQALVNAGSTTGGTLQYSLSSGTGYSDAVPTQTNADTYTVYYKVNGNTNYNAVTEQSVSVTINQVPLTCTADDIEVTYGDAAPTYTATYSGWVNSETESVLTGSLTFACGYTEGSNVGDYTITPSGVTATNYAITFNTGTLTVNKASATITAAPTPVTDLTYDGAEHSLVSAGSVSAGTMKYSLDDSDYSTAIPTASAIGTHRVYYMLDGGQNYTSVSGSLFVETTIAGPRVADNADPSTTLTALYAEANPMSLLMNRTIYADGDYNTICLPFSVTEEDFANPAHPLYGYERLKAFRGAQVSGLGQDLSIDVFVQDATEIIAGTPYLITYPSSHGDIVNPLFANILVTATEPGNVSANGVTFQGMFAPVHITSYEDNTTQDYLFLGANNQLNWPTNDGSSMRGFRAYFIIDRQVITPSMAPRNSRARIVEHTDTTTDIETVIGNPSPVTQKLIENGQLIIIKNGVRYNAQGQVIK